MKKNIFLLLVFIPLLCACSDWLDEEPKAVAAETFYNTVQEADAAVLAPLNKFRSGFAMSYPGLMECFADYQYGRGSWTSNSDYVGLDTQNQTRSSMVWNSLYQAIRDCNIAIEKLPDASSMTDEQKNAYIGELRFLRGLAYFYLVRQWDAVPLRTELNMSEWDMGKTSADEIYTHIISDLEFAIAHCPSTPRLIGTPHKDAAKSVLGHVYLQLKDYSKAASLLKEVIDSNKHSLVNVTASREFEKIFGPDVINTPEEIFYLKNTRTAGWEFVMFCAHPNAQIDGKKMHGAGGWYGLYTTSLNEIIDEWEIEDLRKDYNLLQLDFGMGDNTYLPAKFYDPEAPGNGGAGNSNPLIRYADVLMMYAEAVTQAAGAPNEDAMEKLNMVHRRAYGYPPAEPSPVDFRLSDYPTKEAFMEILIREQAYESYNEGKRWPFLVRLGIAKQEIRKVKNIEVTDKHMLFPIPTTEFSYNKGLDASRDQNPGY
ncbi:MAG: RagB/SusD family nutrient uptake outer membrane protein [Tannerellaceae bacterium]|jgi:tetratricopeptide (TPR) repeat protein|nr:RagB/SusD family nutrient uptake outer membrane protein [Tannerellaceae bacterium]